MENYEAGQGYGIRGPGAGGGSQAALLKGEIKGPGAAHQPGLWPHHAELENCAEDSEESL